MAAYATKDDAVDRYSADYVLVSVTRDGEPDYVALDKALDDATDEIDSRISAQYTVPLTAPVPKIVTRYCIDIAIYFASMECGSGLTDEKRTRYEDAISWLKAVAAGTATLPIPDTPPASQSSLVQTSGPARIFSRCKMGGIL